MKKTLTVLLTLILNSVFSQNIWEPINFPDSLTTYAINAEKEELLFVSAKSNNDFHGLFKSFDNGDTWEVLNIEYPFTNFPILSICYNSEGMLYIGTGIGFFKSTDDGNTFETISVAGNSINEIVISPSDEIFGLGWAYLVRSSDGCSTWDTLFQSHWGLHFSDIDFGLNGEIYIVCRDMLNSGQMGFYRSFDDGLTWQHVGITNQQLESISVNDEGEIIVGGHEGIFTSSDLGLTWTFVSENQADIMKSYDGDKLIAGRNINNYSGCWFSEDWGSTWTDLVDSILNPVILNISISPSFTIYIQSKKSSSYSHQLFKSINPILITNYESLSTEIELFPNPTNNRLKLFIQPTTRIEKYIIYNQNGLRIQSGKFNNESIDITNLKPGLYIIELEFNNITIRKKIIKE